MYCLLPFCTAGTYLCLSTLLRAGQDDQDRQFIQELNGDETLTTVAKFHLEPNRQGMLDTSISLVRLSGEVSMWGRLVQHPGNKTFSIAVYETLERWLCTH